MKIGTNNIPTTTIMYPATENKIIIKNLTYFLLKCGDFNIQQHIVAPSTEDTTNYKFLTSTVGQWPAKHDHLVWSEDHPFVLEGRDTRSSTPCI